MTTASIFGRLLTPIAFLLTTTAAFAADMDMHKGHSMPMTNAMAAKPAAYRLELASPPQSLGGGRSLIAIKFMHGGKPVPGAVIIQSRADMSPGNMAAMTAPIKSLGEQPPGVYRFEVTNGPVWSKPDLWAISVSAKVQGVRETVTSSVTVKLSP